MSTPPSQVMGVLLGALQGAAEFNQDDAVAPAAILWPDKDRQWEALAPKLRAALPHFLTLGDYDPAARSGPAIWLRCVVARMLPDVVLPADAVPILYLPGVSRQELRAVEGCPATLKPLVELQYRGVQFSQKNGKDWTVSAFLSSDDGGLGLDVAKDNATQSALRKAVSVLADTPVESLQGKRLEASDFHSLLTPDPAKKILTWLDNPAQAKALTPVQEWESFCSLCRQQYNIDIEKDGALVGARRLGQREGPWAAVWSRFVESPALYGNIPALLDKAGKSGGADLLGDREPWPQNNENDEADLRKALVDLSKLPQSARPARLLELEQAHAHRRQWVWAKLDRTRLASAIQPLAALAEVVSAGIKGATVEALANAYAKVGWKADAAALQALDAVRAKDDVDAVTRALQAVYLPWLEELAEHFQHVWYTVPQPPPAPATKPTLKKGSCILFADGLRFDIAMRLQDELKKRGLGVESGRKWAALPSVTPTAKPAVSPVAHAITGGDSGEEFRPTVAKDGKSLTPDRFRALLKADGIEYLAPGETGDPAGTAWTEIGTIDTHGHAEGWKLAWRIEEHLRDLVQRVTDLLKSGWSEVRIVTDHGWLLMPGGLPKVDLPGYLAESRWGRCAALKSTSKVDFAVLPWHWNAQVQMVVAPRVGCFKAHCEYAHGGVSLQECLTPEIVVHATAGGAADARIDALKWKGLVCKVSVHSAAAGMKADIRQSAAAPDTSLMEGRVPKVLKDGSASLYVEDDKNEGKPAVVVLLDNSGTVVDMRSTVVGGP